MRDSFQDVLFRTTNWFWKLHVTWFPILSEDMNDERKQGERAIEDPVEDPKAGWFEGEEFRHRLRKIARIVLRKMNRDLQETEDLVQTALLRLYQIDAKRRSEIKDSNAYLYRLMINEVLNRTRKQRSYVVSLDSLETQDLLASNRNLVENPDFNISLLLRELWRQFESEERRLFELIIFGYNSKEIALRLDISEEAARQRVSRLKAKIRANLAGKRVST